MAHDPELPSEPGARSQAYAARVSLDPAHVDSTMLRCIKNRIFDQKILNCMIPERKEGAQAVCYPFASKLLRRDVAPGPADGPDLCQVHREGAGEGI